MEYTQNSVDFGAKRVRAIRKTGLFRVSAAILRLSKKKVLCGIYTESPNSADFGAKRICAIRKTALFGNQSGLTEFA